MESCHLHDLKWVAVWVDGHCFMLERCLSCRKFSVGYVHTGKEPFHNSENISIDQIPVDKLRQLRIFVSRIKPKKVKRFSIKLKM